MLKTKQSIHGKRSHLSCHDFNHPPLHEASDEYWNSRAGIFQRIDMLAQVFSYKVVNNSMKIFGKTFRATYLKWMIVDDDRVCDHCVSNSRKGDNGKFKPSWFMPMMPVHPNCRCQWLLVF